MLMFYVFVLQELRVTDYPQEFGLGFKSSTSLTASASPTTQDIKQPKGFGPTASTLASPPTASSFGALSSESKSPNDTSPFRQALSRSAQSVGSSSSDISPTTPASWGKGIGTFSGIAYANNTRDGSIMPTPTPLPQMRLSTPLASSSLSNEERRREEALVLAGLAKLGYTGLRVEDLGKLVKVDEYENELEVMAEVRAYFKVTYKVCASYLYSGFAVVAVPSVADYDRCGRAEINRLRPACARLRVSARIRGGTADAFDKTSRARRGRRNISMCGVPRGGPDGYRSAGGADRKEAAAGKRAGGTPALRNLTLLCIVALGYLSSLLRIVYWDVNVFYWTWNISIYILVCFLFWIRTPPTLDFITNWELSLAIHIASISKTFTREQPLILASPLLHYSKFYT
jgi:hypothetical protein